MVSGRGARSRFVGGAAISDEEEGPGVANGAVDTEEVEPGRVMVGQERLHGRGRIALVLHGESG